MLGSLLGKSTFKCQLEIQKRNTHAKEDQISHGLRWIDVDLLKEMTWFICRRMLSKPGRLGGWDMCLRKVDANGEEGVRCK